MINGKILSVAALVVGLTVSVFSPISEAQESPEALNHRMTSLYQDVLSPFCPGRSLNDCPSSKAQELKNLMRQHVEAGASNEQVLEQVFATYGEQYRAVPRYAGFGKLIWWIPALFVIVGGCIIATVATRRQRGEASEAPVAGNEISEDLRKLLKEELEQVE